jgi:alginate lyase
MYITKNLTSKIPYPSRHVKQVNMKKMIPLLAICLPAMLQAQVSAHKLEKIWETDTIVAIPESVLPDPANKSLFVSLIDGGGWAVDGKGGVAKLSTDGNHYEPDWITGMNAPKGLGRYGERLFVADISEVVVMNIKKRKIEKKIGIEGANGLNDITVDDKGIVYVSDSRAGKIYRIENDIPGLYMDGVSGANGLKAIGTDLYILANKAVLKADASKNITKITDLPHGGDGIELAGNGDLIVSEWAGYIYYVYADGKKELLLDTHLMKKNTADINYDPVGQILYVPSFNGKTVAAYRLVSSGAPAVFLMDGNRLATLKNKMALHDEATEKIVNHVREQADKLLDMAPLSVMSKSSTPSSGNKHDYMSQAPYFWYDSSKPKGLPYMRRDGERNPEIYTITDSRNMSELSNASRILALTWYLTGEEKYALKAATLLRHWFIEDSTKMNPDLNYAQAIPGVNDGRGTGIIESISLTGIADAAGLLEGSASWTMSDAGVLKKWYAQYLDWMLTSRNGKDEHAAKNNHGTWYLEQVTDFALYTGDTATARRMAQESKIKMDGQIEADGKMPLELARTNGLGYSTYNLSAWFNLATLADRTGVDLWHYQNKNGAGIRAALDWLRPFAMGEKKWEYQQISGFNKSDFYPLLFKAAGEYGESNYYEYSKSVGKGGKNLLMEVLYGE